MTDLNYLGALGLDTGDDVAETGPASAPSAHYIDKRDLPAPNPMAPRAVDEPSTTAPPPPTVPAKIMEPVPTMHGAARVIAAGTATLAVATRATLLGLDPSRPQANQHIAYMLVTVPGDPASDPGVYVAGTDAALTYSRYLIGAGTTVKLEGVAGLWAWPESGTPSVSFLVTAV